MTKAKEKRGGESASQAIPIPGPGGIDPVYVPLDEVPVFDHDVWILRALSLKAQHPTKIANARRDVTTASNLLDTAIASVMLLGGYGDEMGEQQVRALASWLEMARAQVTNVLLELPA